MNVTGTSCFISLWICGCSSTPANAVLLASVLMIHGVLGSGCYSMGSLISVSFAVMNALSHSSVHLNFTFFFRIWISPSSTVISSEGPICLEFFWKFLYCVGPSKCYSVLQECHCIIILGCLTNLLQFVTCCTETNSQEMYLQSRKFDLILKTSKSRETVSQLVVFHLGGISL